jgi:hypothetical protein
MQQTIVDLSQFNHANELRLVKFNLSIILLFYLNFIVVTTINDEITILVSHNFDFSEFIKKVFCF